MNGVDNSKKGVYFKYIMWITQLYINISIYSDIT
uniref:Uncharacterized protein n=1 Tax=Caudovirales sp. ctikv1 TaxID=2826781 RepID=A0A8S5N376_9CAUD|nr:MAG TPA: hypothetical protein [Caudovirales sp. ctikv1]DAS92731.1 MAG TPA: hypothetical protein [Caudoviricetes sp.]